MKFRIQEHIDYRGSKFFKIQKKFFGFIWIDYDDTDFDHPTDAIKRIEIYKSQDERRKNPKIVYESD